MSKKPARPKPLDRGARSAGGRPPASRAGEVDTRILRAATDVFLEHGFDGATYDRIAAAAHAGKSSVYARYPTKEALFAAMIGSNVELALAPARAVDAELPLSSRLYEVGMAILLHSVRPKPLALMRMLIAAAPRMPELVRRVDDAGRDRAVEQVVRAVIGDGEPAKIADERLLAAAHKFVELIFVPHQMRALLGDDPKVLETAAPARLHDAIATLVATGMLDSFTRVDSRARRSTSFD